MIDATDKPTADGEQDSESPSVFKAVEALTKGIELPLPPSHSFVDKDGIVRDRVRARWWDTDATTYRQIANLPAAERQSLPDIDVPPHARLPLADAKPIFFGHYWMNGVPEVQSPSAACVDYSAGKDGPLVAYRWAGHGPLSSSRFDWVR